jgi:SAM-dependent methyltransferase
VSPDEIARGYDRIAEQWNSETFTRSNGIAQHERALQFVKRKRHALDIGCGCSGRFIDLLRSHGFEVEGLDLSPRMLELARRRHPGVTFHAGDICDWQLPRQYDFITAWDSIWHVRLAMQEPLMRKIMTGLAPDGVLIFSMGGLDQPGEKTDSAMGVPMYYSTLGIPRMLEVIAASGCICRHLQYDQYPESHVYVIAQRAQS